MDKSVSVRWHRINAYANIRWCWSEWSQDGQRLFDQTAGERKPLDLRV